CDLADNGYIPAWYQIDKKRLRNNFTKHPCANKCTSHWAYYPIPHPRSPVLTKLSVEGSVK
ncbi:hypothetical protein KA005_82825, partial [bacterium]|nr:hypothetical protein [bacterium]